jgi:hypothetical protein
MDVHVNKYGSLKKKRGNVINQTYVRQYESIPVKYNHSEVYFCMISEDACIYVYCYSIYFCNICLYINVDISKLVRMTSFWSKFHEVLRIKRLETQIIKKTNWSNKTKRDYIG